MKKMGLLFCVGLLGLAACSTQKTIVDTSPQQPTVTLTANTAVSGYVLPDSTGTLKIYTRPTQRRIDSTFNMQSWAARKVIGNTNSSLIGLTEKNVSLLINHPRKTYAECPLVGCANDFWQRLQGQEESEDESFEPNTPESCPMTSTTHYDVIDKKTAREINGFQANQYQLIWKVTNTDLKGRKDEHSLVMDFWMTAPTETVREAWKVTSTYQNNYLQAIGANDSPLGRMLGENIYKPLAALVGDTDKNEDMKMLNGKLAALQGYPVSIKLEWHMDGNTCPEELEERNAPQKEADSGIDFNDAAGSLRSLAGGLLKNTAETAMKKKFQRDPTKPLMRFVYDVTSVSVEQQHDSLFAAPKGYKLTDRR